MRILRTYLLREHLVPFLEALGGLLAVLLVGNIIKSAELIMKGINPLDLLRLIIYLIPYLVSFTVPMAILIAMVLAFGRLNTDYELIAMRASGVAPAHLASPFLVAGLVLSMLMVAVNDQVVPAAHLASRRQLKAMGVQQPTAFMEAGTFIKEFPPYVIFVYQITRQQLHDVRIYEPQPNGPTRTIIADRGEFTRLPNKRGVQLWLYDGTMDEVDPATPDTFMKIAFENYRMTLRTDHEDPHRMGKKLKELTLGEMVQERRRLAAQQIETLPISLELHRRVASSFAALLFVMIGLIFGFRPHHHERLMTFVWVALIFMVYYLGMVGMSAAALKGWMPAWLAMWTPNGVGMAISSVLLIRTLKT